MATFSIIRDDGHDHFSGRITDWAGCRDEIFRIGQYRDSFRFFFRGKRVTADKMLDICEHEEEKYFSKRRPIRVSQGATTLPNTWRTKWILK